MKKTLRCFVLLVLSWVLGTGLAIAADPSPALSPAPQPAIAAAACETPSSASAVEIDLFAAEPQPVAICPLIGCLNGSCRRDRDCTAAPGGVCNLFCRTQGCCAYPSP